MKLKAKLFDITVSCLISLISLMFFFPSFEILNKIFSSSSYSLSQIGMLCSSVALFIMSHFIRSLRIWIMIIEDIKSLTQILRVHFFSAWVVSAIPFKLGEFYRLSMFIHLTRNAFEGTAIFIIEKIVDALTLLIMISAGASLMMIEPEIRFLTIFLVISLFFSILLWMASPGLISYGRKIILTKSQSNKGIKGLKLINFYEMLLQVFRRKFEYRFTLLFMITFIAWILDAIAFTLLGNMIGFNAIEIYQKIILYLENTILHRHDKLLYSTFTIQSTGDLSHVFSAFSIVIMTFIATYIIIRKISHSIRKRTL